MTTMNKKHVYTVPTVEIIDIETSQILAASNEVDVFDKDTDADASMTHKKENTWSHTWE